MVNIWYIAPSQNKDVSNTTLHEPKFWLKLVHMVR